MKRLIALALLCPMLCGCGSETTQPITQSTTQSPMETTTQPTEQTLTQPQSTHRHPLNGTILSEPVYERPFCVVINNIYEAQPLHGVAQADLLFEIVAEGGGSVTRMLAVYSDLSQAGKIGSIRSARTYLLDLAASVNGVLVHSGGSEHAYRELKTGSYDHLDGLYDGAGLCFYRDTQRKQEGYALEHTLFSSGERILDYAGKKQLNTQNSTPTDYGWQFSENPSLPGEVAERIELRFTGKKGKGTFFDYDGSAYVATQYFYNKHSLPLADANDQSPLQFRNVIVLFADTTYDAQGYRVFAKLTGEGTGYFACDGTIVPITWHRDGEHAPFQYRFTDGTPITLGVGSTYVGVLATGSPVTYQ